LVGINDSASLSIAETGNTTYLALGEPSTKAWILQNTIIPEPSSIAFLGLGAAGLLMRRQRKD